MAQGMLDYSYQIIKPQCMYPNMPYFNILLSLTSDDFTCQGESKGESKIVWH
jgi:hypothetical protein